MEVIGAVTTIAGLAQTAFAVSQTIFNLVQTYKDSPSSIRDLRSDVTAIAGLLLQIDAKSQRSLPETAFCRGLKEQHFKETLRGCQRDLDRLKVILSKLTSSSSSATWLRIRNTFKWIYLEEHVDSAKKSLEGHKSVLNIFLSLSIKDDTEIIPDIQSDSSQILQLVRVLVARIGEFEQRNQATYRIAEESLAVQLAVREDTSVTLALLESAQSSVIVD